MWITKLINSKGIRYKYSERFKHPITNKYLIISITLNSESRQAKKSAVEMLRAKFLEKTKSIEDTKAELLNTMTFISLAVEWATHIKQMVKVQTSRIHFVHINKIQQSINDMLFVNFTPAVMEKLIYDIYYTEKLSYNYSTNILHNLKSIMRYAKKKCYIDDISAFEEIKIKKRPATKKELQTTADKFLNKDELKQCLHQLNEINPRIALAMEFIALTGLRCGELLALRLQDYDKEKSTINVNGSMVSTLSFHDDNCRSTPKNIYSYRTIFLNERAKKIIDKFILENKTSTMWHRDVYKDKGYIFTSRTGSPYKLYYINSILHKVQSNKKLTSHIFRHTHISLLASAGLPLKAIMQRVGHNDPNTTLKIYTHVTDDMKNAVQQAVNAMTI